MNLKFEFNESQATTESNNIRNKYQFRVKAVPKGCRNCCCGTDADLRLNLTLKNGIPI